MYRNASSPANPQGSLTAAYALRSLVDPIPAMDHVYVPGDSLDHTWGLIINNASAPREQGLVLELINTGQQAYSADAMEDESLAPGKWWPVEATPGNWMDDAALGFKEITIDLATWAVTGLEGLFQSLPGAALQEQVRQADGKLISRPLSHATTRHKLTLRVLEVTIRRAWLPLSLLATAGWHIEGAPAGYVSTGALSAQNTGLMPLIPSGFLVGVDAALDPVPDVPPPSGLVSVGPFQLADTVADTPGPPPLYLVGMVSQAVRRMPAQAG